MSLRILLDPGHGQGRASNRGSLIGNEGDNNWYFAQVLKEELEKYQKVTVDVFVGTTRPLITDNPTLNQRGVLGKGYDLLLSLHSNAYDGKAHGFVLFDSLERPNRTLAVALAQEISKNFRLNRGVVYKKHPTLTTRSYYGVLRDSLAATSMLLEYGFHDNPVDIKVYVNNRAALAKSTTKAIASHYGLILKSAGGTNMEHKIGDTIEVKNARLHSNSSGAKPGATRTGKYQITNIARGKAYPIHIGNLGWIAESAIVIQKPAEREKPKETGIKAPDGHVYRVVVASFEHRNNAIQLQQELSAKGITTFLALTKLPEK